MDVTGLLEKNRKLIAYESTLGALVILAHTTAPNPELYYAIVGALAVFVGGNAAEWMAQRKKGTAPPTPPAEPVNPNG